MKDIKIKKKKKIFPTLLNQLFNGNLSDFGFLIITFLVISLLYIIYKNINFNIKLSSIFLENLLIGIMSIMLAGTVFALGSFFYVIIVQIISKFICVTRLAYLPLTKEDTLIIADNFEDFKNWFYKNYTYGKMTFIFKTEEIPLYIEKEDLNKIINICQKVYGISEDDLTAFFEIFLEEY